MKIYLLSYSTPKFRLSQLLLALTAVFAGCTKVVLRKQKNFINTEFYRTHQTILINKRGAGYWLWKYYFISELMKQINEGDIIVYCDAGVIFRKSLQPLIDLLTNNQSGVLLFNNDYKNRNWTKRDCFVKLNCDNEAYYDSPLIFGGLQLFQKKSFSQQFVSEVLLWSHTDNLITDSENSCGLPNLSGMQEHRHDQSITSLIAHKHNIKLYPDPSQFKTKDLIYQFPNFSPSKNAISKNIIYVHRLVGLKILYLPIKILREKFNKLK